MFLLLICEELCKLFVEKDIIFDLFRGCLNGSNLGKWDLYFFLELFFLFLVLIFFCFFNSIRIFNRSGRKKIVWISLKLIIRSMIFLKDWNI